MISIESPDKSQLDTVTQWPVWEKEICNFDEDYTAKEMFYILDGEARLTTNCGIDKTIHQGDLVTVEAGLLVNWDIRQPIRKHFKFF